MYMCAEELFADAKVVDKCRCAFQDGIDVLKGKKNDDGRSSRAHVCTCMRVVAEDFSDVASCEALSEQPPVSNFSIASVGNRLM